MTEEESNSEVKLSWAEVKKDFTCVEEAGGGEGGDSDQLARVKKLRLISHYSLKVMETT